MVSAALRDEEVGFSPVIVEYPIVLHPTRGEHGWMVDIPDFPDCVVEGWSLREALDGTRERLTIRLKDMAAQNLPLPQASRLDEISCGVDCIVFHISVDVTGRMLVG